MDNPQVEIKRDTQKPIIKDKETRILTKLEMVFCLKGTIDRMFTPLSTNEHIDWLPPAGTEESYQTHT